MRSSAMQRVAGVSAVAPVLGATIHVLGAPEPVTSFALGIDPAVQGDYELLDGCATDCAGRARGERRAAPRDREDDR